MGTGLQGLVEIVVSPNHPSRPVLGKLRAVGMEFALDRIHTGVSVQMVGKEVIALSAVAPVARRGFPTPLKRMTKHTLGSSVATWEHVIEQKGSAPAFLALKGQPAT